MAKKNETFLHKILHRKLWLISTLLVGAFAMAFVVGAGAYLYYRHYRNPDRFLKWAQELNEQGDFDAAMDQYERAIRHCRSGAQRIQVIHAMINALQGQDPQPLNEAVQHYRTITGLYDTISRLQSADAPETETMLDQQFRFAETIQAPWTWKQLETICARVLRLNEDHWKARKYKLIAGVYPNPDNASLDHFNDLQEKFDEIRKEHPDDPDLQYYAAMLMGRQAHYLNKEYLRPQQSKLFEDALELLNARIKVQPEAVRARVGKIQILLDRARQSEENNTIKTAINKALDLAAQSYITNDPDQALRLVNYLEASRNILQIGAFEQKNESSEEDDENSLMQRVTEHRQDLVDKLCNKYPHNINGVLKKARIMREKNQLQEAVKLLSQAMTERKMKPTVEALIAWTNRMQARFVLMDARLELYEQVADPDKQQELITTVKKELGKLRDIVQEENPYIQIIEGRLAYINEDYRKAVNKFEQAESALGRSTPESLLYSGLGLAQLGETGAAVQQLSKYLSLRNSTPKRRSMALRQLAFCAVQLRNFRQAVAVGRKLLQEDPNNIEAPLVLGRTLMLQLLTGRISNREKIYNEVVDLLKPLAEKGNRKAVVRLSEVYMLAGNAKKARRLLEKHRDKHPDDRQILPHLCQIYQKTNNQDTLAELVNNLIASNPENPVNQWLQAGLKGKSPWKNLLPRLVGAINREDPVKQGLALVELLQNYELETAAEEIYRGLAEKAPDNSDVITTGLERALRNENIATATTLLEHYKEQNPSEIEAATWDARIELAQKDYHAVIELLDPLLTSNSTHSRAWSVLGEAYRQQGDLFNAQDAFQKALALKPDSAYALERMVAVCHARGLYHQALKYMRHTLHFRPNDKRLIRSFLEYLDRHGTAGQALEMRLQLASTNPQDRENRRAIARLYLRTNEPEKAKDVLNKLLQENPNDFATVFEKARYYAFQNQADIGRELLRKYLDKKGPDASAAEWTNFAQYLVGTGQNEQAETAIHKALQLEDPENPVATRFHAQWLLRNNQTETAINKYRELFDKTGEPGALMNLAEAQLQAQKYDAALSTISKYQQDNPATAQMYFIQARAEIATEKYKQARETLTKSLQLAPNQPTPYYLRAKLDLNAPAQSKEARRDIKRDLEKALELNPRFTEARRLLAQYLFQQNHVTAAIRHLKELRLYDPKNEEYLTLLTELHLRAAHLEKAQQILDEWKKHNPDSLARRSLQAHLAMVKEEWETAVEIYGGIFGEKPTEQTLYKYVDALLKNNQPKEAALILSRSEDLTSNDNKIRYYAHLGNVRAAIPEKKEAALEAFDNAIATAVNTNQKHLNQVITMAKNGLPKNDLLKLLNKYYEADPSGIVGLKLAQEMIINKQLEKAHAIMQNLEGKITNDSPIYARMLVLYSNLFLSKDAHEKAYEYLYEAAKIVPEDPLVLNNLAFQMARLGKDPFKAVELAEKALAKGGDSPEQLALFLDTLGYAQLKAGLKAHAESTLKRSLQTKPLACNYMHLGNVYMAQDRPAAARKMFELAQKAATEDNDDTSLRELEPFLEEAKMREAEKKKQTAARK